jgi:hypothetical protein
LTDDRTPFAERLALRPKEAAAALGLSERAFRTLLPTVPHLRAGSAVLIPVEALRRWLEDQAHAEKARTDRVAEEILRSFK